MDTRRIRKDALSRFFSSLRQGGWRILGPRKDADTVTFREVDSPEELALDVVQTTLSPKEVVFPMWEELLRFRHGPQPQAQEVTPDPPPTLVFGLRPCDARAFLALDALFLSPPADAAYQARRQGVTLAAVSCAKADPSCFCTSVGGGPSDGTGSDLLFTSLGETFLVEILTDKGAEAFRAGGDEGEPAATDEKAGHVAQVPVAFPLAHVREKLPQVFDREELWIAQSLRCLGCGACAFVCPTCACFDIQDEGTREGGARLRCWDSCGFSLFTLHASGHNPRERQSQRWRQRVMHKFSYQPERLGVLGCVGCGRCSRACPVDMNLAQHLAAIAEACP